MITRPSFQKALIDENKPSEWVGPAHTLPPPPPFDQPSWTQSQPGHCQDGIVKVWSFNLHIHKTKQTHCKTPLAYNSPPQFLRLQVPCTLNRHQAPKTPSGSGSYPCPHALSSLHDEKVKRAPKMTCLRGQGRTHLSRPFGSFGV